MTTTKKPLPKAVQDIRKVLLPNVCPLWQERIRAARTVAACRKLWEGTGSGDRHIALQRITPDSGDCLGCHMGDYAIKAMTFPEFLKLVRAKAKQLRDEKKKAKAA